MSLIRWEPFAGMDDMFSRLPSLFARWPAFPADNGTQGEWTPSVDISETDKEYLIRATLPAVRKEDVEVKIEDGMLTLCGERRQKEEQKGEKFHKVETFYGRFARSFALPESVDAAAISAESKEGVLTIHVPKMKVEARKPTTVRVQ